MAVAAKSSNCFEIEQYPFNGPVLNKIFYVDLFSRMNYPLTAKYAIGKLITKQT